MREMSNSEQKAHGIAFAVGYSINLPLEAYTPEDWESIAQKLHVAEQDDDVVEHGYLAGRLAQKKYKFGLE